MKSVYVSNGENLNYYLFSYEKNFGEDKEDTLVKKIKTISRQSFQNATDIKQVYAEDKLTLIEEKAFENCENLEVFCCCSSNIKNESKIQNLHIPYCYDNFTIEHEAFLDCKKLQTVVFPKMDNPFKLIIEKDAFKNCHSLRTVVCLCDNISFTENPFKDCPDDLVFVGKGNSELERFARENGYRYIYAQ